jgi:cathepsin F
VDLHFFFCFFRAGPKHPLAPLFLLYRRTANMKGILAVCLFFLISAAVAETFNNGQLKITEDPKDLFINFMQTYNKVYGDVQELSTRFSNFKATIERVNSLNKNSRGAVYGITQFADMSPAEFKTVYLMGEGYVPKASTETVQPADVAVPDTYDWRALGAVTPIKNQEQCGSCWAFSATEAIESAWILGGKATNETVNLAPQQIVDCDTTEDGCGGGETSGAFDYVVSAGGLESNASYPYTAVNGQCEFKKSEVVATISGFKPATSFLDEKTLQSNLVAWGPLSICLDAASWQDYKSGVMSKWDCAFINVLDHCVQLVGYDATASTPYWIVRNSWGTTWGLDGYIWLEMWHDTCGIAHDATWPTL